MHGSAALPLMIKPGGGAALSALGLSLRMTSGLGNAGDRTTGVALLFESFSGGLGAGSSSAWGRVAEEGLLSCSLREAPKLQDTVFPQCTEAE